MKTELLFNAIGEIDDRLVVEAEEAANLRQKIGRQKWVALAACLALVVCAGLAAHAAYSSAAVGAFTMDVNPSAEYTVSRNGTVKSVRFLNDEAEDALRDVVLKKQNVETAMTRTIAAYEACGYMTDRKGTVLISFDTRIGGNDNLKSTLTSEIRSALEQTDAVEMLVFHTTSDNTQAAEIAEAFHVSTGKADCILAAAEKTDFSKEELAQLPLDVLLALQQESAVVSAATTELEEMIPLEKAKQIALADAGLGMEQKVIFTKAEQIKGTEGACWLLEFYTAKYQYRYVIDAKTGGVLESRQYILLTEAKRIAIDDAGCTEKVTFSEETLVDGGIKTPYYRLVFADTQTRWFYRIDAVLGIVLEKTQEQIGVQELLSLEDAKRIAMQHAGLDAAAQKVVFTKTELNRNQGQPCWLLEFYTQQFRYDYKIDAETGEIIGGSSEAIIRPEVSRVPEPEQSRNLEAADKIA